MVQYLCFLFTRFLRINPSQFTGMRNVFSIKSPRRHWYESYSLRGGSITDAHFLVTLYNVDLKYSDGKINVTLEKRKKKE